MKTLFKISIIILLASALVVAQGKSKSSYHKATATIVFPKVTFGEIADKERKLKKLFPDAEITFAITDTGKIKVINPWSFRRYYLDGDTLLLKDWNIK